MEITKQLSPFPMHRLKRVDKPTTVVTDNVQRFDLTNEALMRSFRGEFGPAVQEKAKYFGNRCPLSIANTDVLSRILSCRADQIADKKAPIPDDPGILSNHIKNLGYFLGADIVGICRFPKYAVYARNFSGEPVEIDFKPVICAQKSVHGQGLLPGFMTQFDGLLAVQAWHERSLSNGIARSGEGNLRAGNGGLTCVMMKMEMLGVYSDAAV